MNEYPYGPYPNEDETSVALALALIGQRNKYPDVRCESTAQRYPWGSEIEISYPVGPAWLRKLWRNRLRHRYILLATGSNRVIKLKRSGMPVPL